MIAKGVQRGWREGVYGVWPYERFRVVDVAIAEACGHGVDPQQALKVATSLRKPVD